MSYWLGSVGEIWCWPPSIRWRRRLCGSPVPELETMAWSAVVTSGLAGWVRSARKTWFQMADAGAGADILHVEDVVLEVFVEDARLDFEGSLRGFELVFQLEQVGGAVRGEVESVDEAEGERGEGEDGDDADEAEGADAAGAHGGDFGVGGEAAEAEQDAGENGGGDGDGEGVGEHVARRCGGRR